MKQINLGYIHMESYKPGDKIFSEWFYEEKEYQEEIDNTLPEEVILPANKKYTLTIDYPLSNPFKTELKTGVKGKTRREVINFIVDSYRKVYDEENNTSGVKESFIPGMYNRERTEGKYGIWGHVLGDLILHTLEVKGTKLSLGVDS
jgi:hypothetical protein